LLSSGEPPNEHDIPPLDVAKLSQGRVERLDQVLHLIRCRGLDETYSIRLPGRLCVGGKWRGEEGCA